MAEITKIFTQIQPSACFIGKKFCADQWKNPPALWESFFANGWFEPIKGLLPDGWAEKFPEGGAYIGLERGAEGARLMAYWVGMFVPDDAEAPEGYEKIVFPVQKVAVAYVYGREDGGIYGCEADCLQAFADAGMRPRVDTDGCFWVWERYACPRFTTPDEKGNVILDICCAVE